MVGKGGRGFAILFRIWPRRRFPQVQSTRWDSSWQHTFANFGGGGGGDRSEPAAERGICWPSREVSAIAAQPVPSSRLQRCRRKCGSFFNFGGEARTKRQQGPGKCFAFQRGECTRGAYCDSPRRPATSSLAVVVAVVGVSLLASASPRPANVTVGRIVVSPTR